jgi:hypothetical protein
MAPRASSPAARYIIDEPASPEETRQLFGIGVKRAAKLERWAHEALVAAEGRTPSKAVKPNARRPTKKRSKRRPTKKAAAKL